MRSAPLQRLLALVLAVSLTAMGLATAMARGQVLSGGQVLVLCSGGGLVQITLDAEGAPTGDSHLCPDLAYGLLAALEVSPPDVARPVAAVTDAGRAVADVVLHGQAPVVAQARGPPVRI